jgi:hypothetical protein
MREWLSNILSAIFNRNVLIVKKGENVSMNKLNKFLSLLPSGPVAKVISSDARNNLIEFRLEMPKKRLSRFSKRAAKRKRTWVGGRI